ncbi:MAG: hypothetical protein HYZ37_07945, partial [Candidatus Solibacter usitatus]|nr:hypothetical protein [Candidatus Solibacter usitatus]
MQQSSAPLPFQAPAPPERKLVTVPPPQRKRGRGWLWLTIFAVIGAGLYVLYQKNLAEEAIASKRAAAVSIRSATMAAGKVLATLRLTGTTGPEKFTTILGPQMRGSRSFSGGGGSYMGKGGGGRGGSGGGGSSSGGGGGAVQSNSGSSGGGGGGGGSSSSSIASLSGGGGAGGGGASAAAGGGGSGSSGAGVRSSSGAMKATTGRSSGGGGGRSSLSSGSSQAAGSASLGAEGTGSTSGSLFGGGGPPGGGGGPPGGGGGSSSMGDFGSVIQDLTKPGVTVKKGDKLAEFDRQYMLQRLDDYKAGLVQQESNIKRQIADLDVAHKAHDQQVLIAKSDWEKAQLDLKTIPVRSAIDTERFRLAVEETQAKYKQLLTEEPYVVAGEKAQVKISEMDLQQSKIELRRSEQNAERMVVRSPMDGMAV